MHWFPRGPREREQRNGSVEVLGYWEQVAPGTATESFVLISVVLTCKVQRGEGKSTDTNGLLYYPMDYAPQILLHRHESFINQGSAEST